MICIISFYLVVITCNIIYYVGEYTKLSVVSCNLFPFNDNTSKESNTNSDPISCYDVNNSRCSISDCNYNIKQQVERFVNETSAFL